MLSRSSVEFLIPKRSSHALLSADVPPREHWEPARASDSPRLVLCGSLPRSPKTAPEASPDRCPSGARAAPERERGTGTPPRRHPPDKREVVKTTKSFGELAAAGKRALPLVVLVGVTFAWSVVGPDLHVRAVCAATCALFTRIASELVVCVMTLEPYPRLQPTILLLPCFLVLAMLGVLEGPAGGAVDAPHSARLEMAQRP